MKELKLLSVVFDTEIHRREIPAFRSAIIEKVGIQHAYFHNHNNEDHAKSKFYNRYALVQYKFRRGKPMLLFVDKGVEEAQHFFARPNWEITFAGRPHQMAISEMRMQPYTLKVCDGMQSYRIKSYLPFNQDNYRYYQSIKGMVERNRFLEQKLVAHIIAFASGIDWHKEKWMDLEILKVTKQYAVTHKRVKRMAFDLEFQTNLSLPGLIGLGKGVSFGFGTISKIRKPIQELKKEVNYGVFV